MKKIFFIATVLMWCLPAASTTFAYDRQDSLRGSNGDGRNWWDVQHYTLSIAFDTAAKTIHGSNIITAKLIAPAGDSLQLDLQEPMMLDSVILNGERIDCTNEGNVWWLHYPFYQLSEHSVFELKAYYHGKPRIAKNPPWDGGFIWTKDATGKPWIAVACQGLGASSWWPCKDYQEDEPDSGMILFFESKIAQPIIANGRLSERVSLVIKDTLHEGWRWKIQNPINTYNATFYIGDYISWTDTLMGEKGKLDLTFCVLRHHEQQAREQFKVVKQMLHCFEYWMGPYPFYEDGYKLVEAPYLGMEHQSAVAYGNQYRMGYLGRDRSGTGVGLLFDFIIVHESGHEWFGNNITAQDIADNWLHEGFTTYAEALFAECALGKEKAFAYTRGEWRNIANDRSVIGDYGVNDEGSGDKYDKGSAVVHMIRTIMNNDEQFRQLLRGINKEFYHQTVTSAAIEAYISRFSGHDFAPLFHQYLRTTNIPELEWFVKDKKLFFRFQNIVEGFTLPVTITSGKKQTTIHPAPTWQNIPWKEGFDVSFSKDFLLQIK